MKNKHKHNHHHLTPISRSKAEGKPEDRSPGNLLTIGIERHIYWHKLFGNRTLEEILELLTRLARLKSRQNRKQEGGG